MYLVYICVVSLTFQNEGHTALHVSAWEGDDAAIKYLNLMKANPNITDHVRASINNNNRLITIKF